MAEPGLRERLIALAARDRTKRAELVARGELFGGYHPEMEAVHLENARALEEILDVVGWPPRSVVGGEASDAAWTVAVHGISRPAFQRRCLELLTAAVEAGEALPRQRAALVDRIRFHERRPQVYGTIFDWDERGEMSPWTIEEPATVDERRSAVGLPPLAEQTQRIREQTRREGGAPPRDLRAHRAAVDEWARRTGWLAS